MAVRFDDWECGSLAHYGVKGMKWKVSHRRNTGWFNSQAEKLNRIENNTDARDSQATEERIRTQQTQLDRAANAGRQMDRKITLPGKVKTTSQGFVKAVGKSRNRFSRMISRLANIRLNTK